MKDIFGESTAALVVGSHYRLQKCAHAGIPIYGGYHFPVGEGL